MVLTPNVPTSSKLTSVQVNETKKSIERSFSPSVIDFEVLNFRANHRGDIVVILSTKEYQEKAAAKLAEKVRSLGFTESKARGRLPRQIINGVPDDIEDLTDEIKVSNLEIKKLIEENPNENLR